MYLYLVRHGQSEGNVVRTFHGQTDYPLTERGREQARQAGEKLKGVSFVRCLSSDLSRARDTAEACVAGRGMTVELCPALREQDVGEMEGLSWEEMGERFPGLRERYIEDWYRTQPPGGEHPETMMARVAALVDELIGRNEDVLLVGHFGSFGLVLEHLGLVEKGKNFEPAHVFGQGVYSAIRIEDGQAELVCFNV